MSLLKQFNDLLNTQVNAVAKVTGQRGGGQVVAETLGGATVLLYGTAETDKNVFYDRRTGKVIGTAPDVTFGEYGF